MKNTPPNARSVMLSWLILGDLNVVVNTKEKINRPFNLNLAIPFLESMFDRGLYRSRFLRHSLYLV